MDFMPSSNLPAVPANDDKLPVRTPLVPERTEFLEGDSPAAAKVEAFLAQALAATGSEANITAGALVPWICDALLSNHSVKAYGRDLMDFLRHMQAQGVDPLHVTPDHVKFYKRALLEAGRTSATVARRLSVLWGTGLLTRLEEVPIGSNTHGFGTPRFRWPLTPLLVVGARDRPESRRGDLPESGGSGLQW